VQLALLGTDIRQVWRYQRVDDQRFSKHYTENFFYKCYWNIATHNVHNEKVEMSSFAVKFCS